MFSTLPSPDASPKLPLPNEAVLHQQVQILRSQTSDDDSDNTFFPVCHSLRKQIRPELLSGTRRSLLQASMVRYGPAFYSLIAAPLRLRSGGKCFVVKYRWMGTLLISNLYIPTIAVSDRFRSSSDGIL